MEKNNSKNKFKFNKNSSSKNSSNLFVLKKFSKSTINNIVDFYKNQQEKIKSNKRKQFTFFLLGFVIFYLFFTAITFPFQNEAKIFTGNISQGFLLLQGIETTFVGMVDFELENAYAFTINHTNQLIVISWLCSGVLEIIILISAILASFGISFKKKLIGIIVAIISGLIFNFIRIFITLQIIMMQNAQVFEIAHDLLFRLTLLLYIIIIYVLWFNWANKK